MDLRRFALTLLLSGLSLSLAMAIAWAMQQVLKSSRWVDASWSFSIGAVAFVASLAPFDATHWRQIMVADLVAVWSFRLSGHLAGRNRSVADDPRYRALAEQWGAKAPRRMFWFLQSQAMVGTVLVVSVALAAHRPGPAWQLQDVFGALLLIAAVLGETIADRQLTVFRRNRAEGEVVCDRGLWHWSRHPNYFFEWLGWVAFALMGADFTGSYLWGWLAVAAPAVMYWVLVHVSGIPPLEQHMLRTRGEAYRAYQERISPFFLWPARRRATAKR